MEFSMRSFTVVSLLLLVSLSTDMISSGPLMVDAQRCNWDLCRKYCSLLGKPACCAGISGPCRCTAACPRMSGPLQVDARKCDWNLCRRYCSLQGMPACCPGPSGPCRCTAACPRYDTKEIAEEIMAGATNEELIIIKDTVTA